VFLPLAVLTGFFGQNFSYLVNAIEPREWVFWVLGVAFEVGAAIGLFALIKWRRWL
jgi:Mg2+ and Co2+ transporter CorA